MRKHEKTTVPIHHLPPKQGRSTFVWKLISALPAETTTTTSPNAPRAQRSESEPFWALRRHGVTAGAGARAGPVPEV